jgi:Rps23 Pro-64 3,4-dihydroxylase Tpa1-like proline 4-hydroxylase
MKPTYSTDSFAVFDDVLSGNARSALWNFVQSESYEFVQKGTWNKVYDILDGNTLVASETYSSVFPSGRDIDSFIHYLERHQTALEPWTGKRQEEWQYFTARPNLYPQGTGLSWHTDSSVSAAYIYYVHPQWNANWGGELMVRGLSNSLQSPICQHDNVKSTGGASMSCDGAENNEFMADEIGYYIAPKPNRLVVLRSGVHHMIKRVEPAAGDHTRISIAGFFINEDPVQ